MDAVKILGSLLGNNATASDIGGQFLDQLTDSLRTGSAQPGGNWSGGLGSVLGSMLGQAQSRGGGLGDLLGSVLGGRTQAGGAGGMGDILGNVLRGGTQTGGVGGMGDILGSILGGGRSRGGSGLNWGLLAGLGMAAYQMLRKRGVAAGHSALANLEQSIPPEAMAEMQQQALVLTRAMINAAKADGTVDAQEQHNILSKLADVGSQETAFLQSEFAKPLSMDFLNGISAEMAPGIYTVSLMAINLDTPEEANYLRQLAQVLGLNEQIVNNIHQQLGVAPLYS